MKLKIKGGKKITLILLLMGGYILQATAQWQVGERVWTPPPFGTFYSMSDTNYGPLPFLPFDCPVYFVSVAENGTSMVFAYDDSDYLSTHSRNGATTNGADDPPDPGGGGEPGDDPGPDPPPPSDYGTGLFIMTGRLSNSTAWLALTNTPPGTYYQMLSRTAAAQGAWELGEIRLASASNTPFANIRTDDPKTRFFLGVGGNTIVSITSHPDYNFAVEPVSATNASQSGKFLVSINPTLSSPLTVVYQISGQATNGVDYTSISGSVNIAAGTASVTIDIDPKYDVLPEFDESVTLSLVLTNGYLVSPTSAVASIKIYDPRPSGMAVAIHDSGWTRFNRLSSTNWNYFVLPEALKEALRSDGTPYAVVSDLDIANGALMNNGVPKYPILISLASESIRDDEIAALTNYVAAGGFIFAGSSSFTRSTDGSFRTNFALASQMGLNCSPSATNWAYNSDFMKLLDHRVVQDIPTGTLTWRMPTSSEETSWGNCQDSHSYAAPHQIWQVSTNSGVQLLGAGDFGFLPYLALKQYGSGYFIYDAALQPLVGHGGFGPGMYAYMIFRRAIEWSFVSAQRPVVRLSPWPYPYDAAFMIRHDLENFVDEVAAVSASAYIEYTNGAKGDYYFCTGAITNDPTYSFSSILSGLQQAVGSYGATIGPHNGGLPNPRHVACNLTNTAIYEYWHWGPDEAVDIVGGSEYASNSLAISFTQIENWLTNQTATPRLWVAPYFNSTRENCYQMEEGLNVKITGDQKLTPFPAFTLSTRTDGKRYDLLSQPVSDWFVNGSVAQSLDPWHSPGIHTSQTMHDGVDFYYANGFLINFYAHGLSTGNRPYDQTAGYLIPDYLGYCMSQQRFPRLWSSNAREIYAWWIKRYAVQVIASYGMNGSHSVATIMISGSQDTNTTVEILATGFGSAVVSQLLTNGVAAATNTYRTSGELIKIRVGTAITKVQTEYYSAPLARDDFYITSQTHSLTTVAAAGVLSNDWSGSWAGLSAITNTVPLHGSLQWDANHDGGFTYTPATNGTECFSYSATDGTYNFGSTTVTLLVSKPGTLYSDDFKRCSANTLYPWQVHSGAWSMAGNVMQGSQGANYANCYLAPLWTNSNFSVEAQVQLNSAACGGGLGARLATTNGAHYAAWLYPDSSPCGANHLALVKFSTSQDWGYNGVPFAPMAQTNVAISSGWHPLKLVCSNSVIQVFYHGTNVVSMADTETQVYSAGGASLDVYNGVISVTNLVVTPIP